MNLCIKQTQNQTPRMDMLKFMTSKPGSRAFTGPYTSKTPQIKMPLGPGMANVTEMPIPQSGLSRAQWFESNHVQTARGSASQIDICTPSGKPSIGANERMVLGAQRDDMMGATVFTDHNWYMMADPVTHQSDDVARIWNSQVTASDGLWDDNNEVYVQNDVVSIWD